MESILNGKRMRGLEKMLMVLLVFICISLQAGEKEKIIKTNAETKAKTFVLKWVDFLELNKEQVKKIYRLRYEMSVSLQLLFLQYADKPEVLLEFAEAAKNDFHVGLRKVLTPQQAHLLSEMRKEILDDGYVKSNISVFHIAETRFKE